MTMPDLGRVLQNTKKGMFCKMKRPSLRKADFRLLFLLIAFLVISRLIDL